MKLKQKIFKIEIITHLIYQSLLNLPPVFPTVFSWIISLVQLHLYTSVKSPWVDRCTILSFQHFNQFSLCDLSSIESWIPLTAVYNIERLVLRILSRALWDLGYRRWMECSQTVRMAFLVKTGRAQETSHKWVLSSNPPLFSQRPNKMNKDTLTPLGSLTLLLEL